MARVFTHGRVGPSELRKEAEKMLKEGTMPGLDEVMKAIGETRKEFSPRILEARTSVPKFPEQQLEVPKAAPSTTPLETGLAAFKKAATPNETV
jgi:hypothetical protein